MKEIIEDWGITDSFSAYAEDARRSAHYGHSWAADDAARAKQAYEAYAKFEKTCAAAQVPKGR